MCGSMADIQSAAAEIRRGKEEEEEEEEQTTARKYIWSALLHRATINKHGHENTKYSIRRVSVEVRPKFKNAFCIL